jgi:competence protein ComGC
MSTFDPRFSPKPACVGFTLIELLVVVGLLVVLVAVRMPALCRTKTPVNLVQCLSNCRQLGTAAMLYRADNHDAYPYGSRVYGSGSGDHSVVDPTGWPMQLLRYTGKAASSQPKVFLCPSEKQVASNWAVQLHYQANRMLVTDTDELEQPRYGAEWRNPAIYWLFMEKGPLDWAQTKPGGLANPVLASWNVPPGATGYRRHSGGLAAAAADGHVDWLLMPRYQPNALSPASFPELGDCANGWNNPSTWPTSPRSKLYCRYSQVGPE